MPESYRIQRGLCTPPPPDDNLTVLTFIFNKRVYKIIALTIQKLQLFLCIVPIFVGLFCQNFKCKEHF